MKPIVVMLTDEQIAILNPHLERLDAMAKEGKPGMLVAQVFVGHMRVGIINNDRARLLTTEPDTTIICAPELDEQS
jgi:hypothetical protein